jgi:hypothetical protein
MRLVDRSGPGTLALNYMWLPTFIGMNGHLIREIEEYISPAIVGRDLDESTLDLADSKVLEFLEQRFPNVPGLFDYLDGLKYVTANG